MKPKHLTLNPSTRPELFLTALAMSVAELKRVFLLAHTNTEPHESPPFSYSCRYINEGEGARERERERDREREREREKDREREGGRESVCVCIYICI